MADESTSKAKPKKCVFTGTFIHTPSLGELSVLNHAVVGVEDGIIQFVQDWRRVSRDTGT